MSITFVVAYVLAAVLAGSHALYYGVVRQPRELHFTRADYLILGGTALLAGAAWILFAPVMAAQGLRALIRARGAAGIRALVWPVRKSVHAH